MNATKDRQPGDESGLTLAELFDEVGRHRRAGAPLHAAAVEALRENMEKLSADVSHALAIVGLSVLAEANCDWPRAPDITNWPQECPPAVRELVATGAFDDRDNVSAARKELSAAFRERRLSEHDITQVLIVGLWTVAREHFKKADAGN